MEEAMAIPRTRQRYQSRTIIIRTCILMGEMVTSQALVAIRILMTTIATLII
jgi:hypothetical protein